MAEQTVKYHLSNIYRKLGVANRTQASHYAHVHRLLDPPAPAVVARPRRGGSRVTTAEAARRHRDHAELCGGENRLAGPLQGRFRRGRAVRETGERSRRVALAVELAKQGDREALRYLYVEYADNVYGYVASLVRDEHEAEDITQQVFAKLMIVLPRYELRGVPFSAWILRVAYNAAMDVMRQRRAIPCASAARAGARARTARTVTARWCSARRSTRCRRTSAPSSCCATSSASRRREIADRLGRTERSVHGLHHRGRGALKAGLLERGAGPAVAA